MRRVLALSAVLLLSACGGGGEDDKAAFVEQATAICAAAAEQNDALTFPSAPADFAPYADEVVAIAEQAEGELSALELPEADADDLRSRVLEPFADVVQAGRDFAADVRAAGDDQAALLPLLGQVPDAGEVDLEYLRSYGLQTCAEAIDTRG